MRLYILFLLIFITCNISALYRQASESKLPATKRYAGKLKMPASKICESKWKPQINYLVSPSSIVDVFKDTLFFDGIECLAYDAVLDNGDEVTGIRVLEGKYEGETWALYCKEGNPKGTAIPASNFIILQHVYNLLTRKGTP